MAHLVKRQTKTPNRILYRHRSTKAEHRKNELHKISRELKKPVTFRKSCLKRFRFAENTLESIGQVSFQIDTPAWSKTYILNLDVVNTYIPVLLGIEINDREHFSPYTAVNLLSERIAFNGSDAENVEIDE